MSYKLEVTDHAIIRYMERVMGLNFYDIRQVVASEEITQRAARMGNGKYHIEGTKCRSIIFNHKVVTVI